MIKSYDRGHEIYFKNDSWYYLDTNKICTYDRPCKRCGEMPTSEGYDACIGYVEGVNAACCGHGVQEKYIKFDKENNYEKE